MQRTIQRYHKSGIDLNIYRIANNNNNNNNNHYHNYNTNNIFTYFQVVRRDLMRAIRKKRPGMADELENVVYHHDNAPPHKAASTELELAILGFQRIAHSPYSPDLAPLDFAYFPALKDYLRGRKYADTDEVKHAILSFNRSLSPQWFKDTFTRWVRRHEKCIEHQGQYFEKL